MFYYITTEAIATTKGLTEIIKGKSFNLYKSDVKHDSTNDFYMLNSEILAMGFKKSPYIMGGKITEHYKKAFERHQLIALDHIDALILNDNSSELLADKKAIENYNFDKIKEYSQFSPLYDILLNEK